MWGEEEGSGRAEDARAACGEVQCGDALARWEKVGRDDRSEAQIGQSVGQYKHKDGAIGHTVGRWPQGSAWRISRQNPDWGIETEIPIVDRDFDEGISRQNPDWGIETHLVDIRPGSQIGYKQAESRLGD